MIERMALVGCCLLMACSPKQTTTPQMSGSAEATVNQAKMGEINGTLVYRERIALTPAAVAEVWLLDSSLADAPAETLAHLEIAAPGNPPITWTLSYPLDAIDARRTYSLRATIREDDRLLFTTDRIYSALTGSSDSATELLLVRAGTTAATPAIGFASTRWELVAIGSESYIHEGEDAVPHISYAADTGAISGYSGCNQFSGGLAVDGGSFTLGPMAVTQRACMERMDLEPRFLSSLGTADRYETDADNLTLFDGDEPVLVFRAVDEN